jgi:hypothetical protein
MAQRDDTGRAGGLPHDKFQVPPLGDRLQHIEHSLLGARGSSGADMSLIYDRIGALERALQTELSQARLALEALAARPEASVSLSTIAHRLDVIEEALLSRETGDGFKGSDGLASEVRALAAAVAQQKSEIAVSVLTPLREQLDQLTATVENRQSDVALEIAELARNVTSLEKTFLAEAERAEETRLSFKNVIAEIHDALAKLNSNQHTLADTFYAQSQDTPPLIAGLAERMDTVEDAVAKPTAMLEDLSRKVEQMHKLTSERYFKRNRFWYWLFGTHDWVAASWPEKSAGIADALSSIKRPLSAKFPAFGVRVAQPPPVPPKSANDPSA